MGGGAAAARTARALAPPLPGGVDICLDQDRIRDGTHHVRVVLSSACDVELRIVCDVACDVAIVWPVGES
jgi:hypothetical protein